MTIRVRLAVGRLANGREPSAQRLVTPAVPGEEGFRALDLTAQDSVEVFVIQLLEAGLCALQVDAPLAPSSPLDRTPAGVP